MPDVDLFLRPSGEFRSSNFLIWQSAYAEYVYQHTLFPDFDHADKRQPEDEPALRKDGKKDRNLFPIIYLTKVVL